MFNPLLTAPAFFSYLGFGVLLSVAFIALYVRITPYREFALIREGNVSAAVSLIGALLGFVLPLASAMAHSVSITDLVAWGLVAMLVQIAGHFALRAFIGNLHAHIEADRRSVALLMAFASVALGMLNAAAMVY